MSEIILVRHGKTQGNIEHRYIGTTDQPMLESELQELQQRHYPHADLLYTSPMVRCKQTAHILYPQLTPTEITAFKETDFGLFEGKNYQELKANPDYQAWLDSGGQLPFPKGESIVHFKQRCTTAFLDIATKCVNVDVTIALVVHGGTIMAILEEYSHISSTFYDWHVENGNGYRAILNKEYKLEDIRKLW